MVDAREYHERTKHSPRKLRETDFSLDPETRPRPYKVYRDLPREELEAVRPPQMPALSAVANARADPTVSGDSDSDGGGESPAELDRETLATLCYLASGVTDAVERDGREVRYRAASCTGKLYHVDCYLVVGDVSGLAPGVYHFDPDAFALDVLREGDFRNVLADAADSDALAEAPVTAVATSTWWRNAWKYRERTFRHAFWDSGTVLANLLAGAHALGHRAEVVAGFDDDAVVDLLGVTPDEEAPVALAPLGAGDVAGDAGAPDVAPLAPDTEPYSPETVDYPLVVEAWEQGRLAGDDVADWRERAGEAATNGVATRASGDGERIPLDPVDHETASARPLWNVVRRRRSCRNYADESLSRRKLGTVLDRATRGVPGDWNGGDASGLAFNDAYVLVTDVEGVPDGAYQFHPDGAELERVGDSDASDMTRLALQQEWAGDAHVDVYLLSDVDALVEATGNRGYRLAQLEAGVVLGRLYLATYAHRDLGGTGLTFFDDMVTDHLSPRATGQTPTTMFALGVAAE